MNIKFLCYPIIFGVGLRPLFYIFGSHRRRPTPTTIIFRNYRRRPTPTTFIFKTYRRSPTPTTIIFKTYRRRPTPVTFIFINSWRRSTPEKKYFLGKRNDTIISYPISKVKAYNHLNTLQSFLFTKTHNDKECFDLFKK